MSALAQLSPEFLQQAMANMTPEQLAALGLRRPATDAEFSAYQQAHQTPGAPADFGGMVLPNPNDIQVSDDTDSGIPVTRLPNGVSFDRSNFHGEMPGDVSNPPRAALATTVGDWFSENAPKAAPQSTAPQSAAPAAVGGDWFDQNSPAAKSSSTAKSETEQRGILDREIPLDSYTHATESGLQSIGRGLRDAAKGTWDTITAPPKGSDEKAVVTLGPPALALYRTLRGAGHTIADATQIVGAIHDINQSTDPVGSYAKAAQETAGQGAGQALLALGTEGAIKAAPGVADTLTSPTKMSAPVRAVVRGINKGLEKAPGTIGGTVGAGVGGYVAGHIGAEIGGGAGALAGRELLPQLEIPGENFGFPKRVAGGPSQAPNFVEKPSITPSEVEDFEGVTSPQTEHASETIEAEPETKATVSETPAEILNKKASPADLERTLNEALGGKPLARNAPIAKRPGVTAVDTSKPAALPEGYTPTESSVLKGYRYDPESETLHAVTNAGQHYAHSGITPEQFDAFEAAPSKGAEWNNLRKAPGVVQVEKNFQPSKPGTITTETGDVIPKSKAGMTTGTEIPPELAEKVKNLSDFIKQSPKKAMATPAAEIPTGTPTTWAEFTKQNMSAAMKSEGSHAAAMTKLGADWKTFKSTKTLPDLASPSEGDLTSLLQQSVEQATGKGGVFTSAEPKALLDRWGVDPESFAAGREQTRGLKPEESVAGIKKLTAAYKRGEAIEPVVEMRDAQNNIIEVDGRGRALAAHKAGIDRIPIIVRRIGASE